MRMTLIARREVSLPLYPILGPPRSFLGVQLPGYVAPMVGEALIEAEDLADVPALEIAEEKAGYVLRLVGGHLGRVVASRLHEAGGRGWPHTVRLEAGDLHRDDEAPADPDDDDDDAPGEDDEGDDENDEAGDCEGGQAASGEGSPVNGGGDPAGEGGAASTTASPAADP